MFMQGWTSLFTEALLVKTKYEQKSNAHDLINYNHLCKNILCTCKQEGEGYLYTDMKRSPKQNVKWKGKDKDQCVEYFAIYLKRKKYISS